MKRTFCEIAQARAEGRPLTDGECRRVLGWFGGPPLYFAGEGERRQALDALAWLCQNAPGGGKDCAASFARALSLPLERARALTERFSALLHRRDPIVVGVEGLDGAGKTVQAERLRRALEGAGKRVLAIDFPQYDSFFGREIGALLAGKEGASALELDERSMSLWFAMDRWKALDGLALEGYDYVIFNRYTLSNVVYQTARRCGGLDRGFAEWIFVLEHIQLGLPIPDLYLYLHTKADLCGENVLKKEGRRYTQGLDVYESAEELLERCHHMYRELAQEIREICVLNCLDGSGRLKGVDEIGGSVLDCLAENGLAP